MTVLAHMAVGAAVGSLVGGRGTAFALGLVSHIPLDVIPHYEFENLWLEVGIIAALFGSMLFFDLEGTAVFWGAVGAVAPDFENFLWRRGALPGRWKVFPGHAESLARFLPHGRALGLRHAWWQAAIVGGSAWVVGWRLLTATR